MRSSMRRSTPAMGEGIQGSVAAWTAARWEKSAFSSMERLPPVGPLYVGRTGGRFKSAEAKAGHRLAGEQVAERAAAWILAGGARRDHQRDQVVLARMAGAAARSLGPFGQAGVARFRILR